MIEIINIQIFKYLMDRNKIKDIIKIINIIEIMLVLVKICINLAILNKFLIQMLKII